MAVIHRLPIQLCNQISAGEVIERPASIVKECIENSLDAGATHISLSVDPQAFQFIRIRDNGCGISPEDLPLALARHATSKIRTLDDLYAIQTLGFRGEALASMASVSRCRLISRQPDSNEAWQFSEESLARVSHPVGTSVEIEDLFYNVPVRRKFLKSMKTELYHIEDMVRRFALSAYSVRFDLWYADKLRLQFPAALNPAQIRARLTRCLGRPFVQSAQWIQRASAQLAIEGWIGGLAGARRQADQQMVFVNGRMVRDKLIAHAVKERLSGEMPAALYPSFLVYLSVPVSAVDVNVHPTKQEVRFHEPREIHAFVMAALEEGLGERPLSEGPALYTPDALEQVGLRRQIVELSARYVVIQEAGKSYLVDVQRRPFFKQGLLKGETGGVIELSDDHLSWFFEGSYD